MESRKNLPVGRGKIINLKCAKKSTRQRKSLPCAKKKSRQSVNLTCALLNLTCALFFSVSNIKHTANYEFLVVILATCPRSTGRLIPVFSSCHLIIPQNIRHISNKKCGLESRTVAMTQYVRCVLFALH